MIGGSSARPRRQQAVGGFAVGIAAGVLLALLTSYVPVIAIAGVAILIIANWVVLGFGHSAARSAQLAGVVLGAGAVLLYGAIATIQACSQTDTFCGDANVLPLLAFALVAAISGLLAGIILWARARRRAI